MFRSPKITLEQTKGLSDAHVEQLTQQLCAYAATHKDEVIIFELAQMVQTFLHANNKAPAGSFYDQMLQDRRRRDQEQEDRNQQLRSELQQTYREEVLKRREEYRSETKGHRETRRSISESSPKHRTTSSSAEHSEGGGGGGTSSSVSSAVAFSSALQIQSAAVACTEHRSCEHVLFPIAGRSIYRGSCLRHSKRGFVAFSGIDALTGQLLYVTEWNIKYAKWEGRCVGNCADVSACVGHHTGEEIIAIVEQKCAKLVAQIEHSNLVRYECVKAVKRKDGFVLYVVQDFVFGTSVNCITDSFGWCVEGASKLARGVLEALIYLHSIGVSHSNLYDYSVFMDITGTIRVTDYSLIPYLHTLMDAQRLVEPDDFTAIGVLLESLGLIPTVDMRDFIDTCKSGRTLTPSDLMNHPFLKTKMHTTAVTHENHQLMLAPVPPPQPPMQPQSQTESAKKHDNAVLSLLPSRLHSEFERLEFLGRGAYGDVMKVRNKLDNRVYAIKRILISTRRKQIYRKMRREVELLSRLNHENVVRYYNSWIETGGVADGWDEIVQKEDGSNNEEWSVASVAGAAATTAKSPPSPPQQAQLVVLPKNENNSSSSSSEEDDDDDDEDEDDDDDDDWQVKAAGGNDSSSGGIEFRNSDGELVVSLDDDDGAGGGNGIEESIVSQEAATRRSPAYKSPRPDRQTMYIQMEFCDKSTLR